jgi:hypothetical protein
VPQHRGPKQRCRNIGATTDRNRPSSKTHNKNRPNRPSGPPDHTHHPDRRPPAPQAQRSRTDHITGPVEAKPGPMPDGRRKAGLSSLSCSAPIPSSRRLVVPCQVWPKAIASATRSALDAAPPTATTIKRSGQSRSRNPGLALGGQTNTQGRTDTGRRKDTQRGLAQDGLTKNPRLRRTVGPRNPRFTQDGQSKNRDRFGWTEPTATADSRNQMVRRNNRDQLRMWDNRKPNTGTSHWAARPNTETLAGDQPAGHKTSAEDSQLKSAL